METKSKIFVAIAALLVSFAAGRYTVPEKIKTVTVEVEKKTDNKETDRDTHKKTKTVTVEKPDGTKETTTETDEDSETKRTETKTDDTSKTSKKEVVRGDSKVTISALSMVGLKKSGPVDFGGMISKPVLGPVTIGAFGFQSGQFGLAVGVTF